MSEIGIGTQIRVTTIHQWPGGKKPDFPDCLSCPNGYWLTGKILALDEYNVQLDVDSEPHPLLLPREAVVNWEVGGGRNHLKGALFGAGAGVFVSLLGVLGCGDSSTPRTKGEEDSSYCGPSGKKFLKVSGIIVGASTLIGLVIGTKRWKVVSTERVEVAIGTQPGMGLSLSVSF